MRLLLNILLLIAFLPFSAAAADDTTNIPISRRIFHDKIKEEQKLADKSDGRLDGVIKVSPNPDVNIQVTDALIRKINVLRNDIEIDNSIPTNNDKVRYLRYVEDLLKSFMLAWKTHKINPSLAPLLVDNFDEIVSANIKGENMTPLIQEVPYEVGAINASIFVDNPGYQESKVALFRKFCKINPDKILQNLGPYVNQPFADSLIIQAFNNSPSQLYTYAQSKNSPQGKLIQGIDDPRIKMVVKLSTQPRALFYFPFLDDLISGKKTIEEIEKVAGTTDANYDSVGYYRLLVKTEIQYYGRMVKGDTPVAMLGANGLLDMLKTKAIQHFITPINVLHESSNPAVRFRALQPLNAQELY